MFRSFSALIAILVIACAFTVSAAEYSSDNTGFQIVPVRDVQVNYIPGDESAPRVYEIIRPYNEPFTIGRLNTSCSCVQLEAPKSTFARGERAFVTLRNVRATPPNGQNYSIFVQINSPVRTTLRHDLFLQSDRFRSQQPAYTNVAY